MARFGDALAVLGAGGVVLRYPDDGGEPTVLAQGLVDPTAIRVDGDRLLVAERHAGRVSAVDATARCRRCSRACRRGRGRSLGDGYVVSAGRRSSSSTATATSAGSTASATPRASPPSATLVLVADAARHELVAVDVASGRRSVVVAGAPVGLPVPGVVPAAFSPRRRRRGRRIPVGCNGDGSIRRLSRTSGAASGGSGVEGMFAQSVHQEGLGRPKEEF